MSDDFTKLIKPCPFVHGGHDVDIVTPLRNEIVAAVLCNVCGARGPQTGGYTEEAAKQAAIAAWNSQQRNDLTGEARRNLRRARAILLEIERADNVGNAE